MKKNLYNLFANVYALYTKTQCYHWNIKGKNFLELHKLFEGLYQELSEDVDSIAERIRMLGFLVPANLEDIQGARTISRSNEKFSSDEMIKDTMESYKEIKKQIEPMYIEYDAEKDISTLDLLTQKLSRYEKNIWFLESFL